MEGKSMLCPIFASSCRNGEMILPQDLCSKFSNEIPETVYLGVRNGEAWRGYYRHGCGSIVNLGAMMSFYRIKPYNIILLRYKGDGDFNMEIFNDNVEIEYPLKFFSVKKQRLAVATGAMTDLSRGTFTDLQMENMAAKFFYKASGNSRMSYDLTIESEHLQMSNLVKVMLEEAISKLRLHSEMRWIELGFERSKWLIKLIWRNGGLYFNEDWIKFTKALNLSEGDICVISRSTHLQKFKVAILEKREEVKVIGHFYFKSFKILTNDMLDAGDLELPRHFIEAYSGNLSKELNLIMADGSIYHAHFCEMENLLYGLKGLFVKLGLGQGFYLFFDYVGPSYLYLSVYNPSCLDIFNYYGNKKSLKDIRKDYMVLGNEISNSCDESSDVLIASSYGGNPGLEMRIKSDEPLFDSASALSLHSSNHIGLSCDGYNSVP